VLYMLYCKLHIAEALNYLQQKKAPTICLVLVERTIFPTTIF